MLAIVHSIALIGLEGYVLRVEVDVAGGLPAWEIVGLPDTAVREAKDRVKAAIRNAGFDFPSRKITVNLAPADIKKEGSAYDLPIALGILAATQQLSAERLSEFVFLGELSLDGSVRPVSGVLPAIAAVSGDGFRKAVVPLENAGEAALVPDMEIYGAENLSQLTRFLSGEEELVPFAVDPAALLRDDAGDELDMADVKGHPAAKRALEVAAAGGHNVLMLGPPGSGKTMLARRVPGILPSLTLEEAIECTKLFSLCGLLAPGQHLVTRRPFRAPHHTCSSVALAGGGKVPRPGEISLANKGVLFLDELPEFPRDALEALRQPLEDGTISISRVSAAVTYPAEIMLVASMNPCPCGYYGDPQKECRCSPLQIQRYVRRVSGPLLDRIDIQIEVGRLNYSELTGPTPGERSSVIRARVEAARAKQRERLAGTGADCNARMTVRQIRQFCRLTPDAAGILKAAFDQLDLSARAHDRILKVARTIADLEGCELIEAGHIAEAVQYRTLDRKYWA
ncbi:MAG: YifB family Mg chelatase-like AAA ATPase [Bacillota bacterium]